jgi:hypothetical protein
MKIPDAFISNILPKADFSEERLNFSKFHSTNFAMIKERLFVCKYWSQHLHLQAQL